MAYTINNYYLYSISHPGKRGLPSVDLSNDNEAHVRSKKSTDQQMAVERVIKKVFFAHGITVDITDKIRAIFRGKLWRMGQALSKLGGTNRHHQIEKWKETTWDLNIPVEVSKQILYRKRQLEEKLENEVAKKQKIEQESVSLRKEVKALRMVSKEQAKTIVTLKMGKENGGRGSSSKDWSSYSAAHRSVKRKRLVTDIKTALSCCDEHFIPLSVDVENTESGKVETIDLKKDTFNTHNKPAVTPESLERFTLYVKDQFSLSDNAYREISQLTPSLPRLFKLKALTKDLNSDFEITPCPNDFIGVQQSFKTRLLHRLQQLKLTPGETIQVKLTGDGTNIAKHIHVVNFAFTLLNEGSLALSPFGNHSLAILQVPENYESLLGSLSDIISEASELESIVIGGSRHEIEYFLGGDMKFLAIACGIEAANATYSCVWCKCPSAERWDMQKEWSAFDQAKGARTVDEIVKFSKLPKARRFGCRATPMFKFVPINHVIIDSLHLFLRVSDLLTNLLIQDLRRVDGIAKATLDPSKHLNVVAYERFLNDICKIPFRWYTSQETKQMEWRDLSGPEKVRLFKNVNMPKYFPALPNASAIQDIWIEFWRILGELEKSDVDPDELQADIKNWVTKFLRVYQTKNITPYVHSFVFHVPEFMAKYGSICKFTQQGLEKLNDLSTQHFLRATNHRSNEALKQVMEKRNRLEQLTDEGFKRTPRVHHCSVCKQTGHTKRNCPSREPLTEIGVVNESNV